MRGGSAGGGAHLGLPWPLLGCYHHGVTAAKPRVAAWFVALAYASA